MKKMNKTFLAGTAFAISAVSAMSLNGCCLLDLLKPAPTVYGPPEYFETTVQDEQETTPAPNPTVYGPPEMLETSPQTPETDISFDNDFDPEEEIIEDVYGPPEWFE